MKTWSYVKDYVYLKFRQYLIRSLSTDSFQPATAQVTICIGLSETKHSEWDGCIEGEDSDGQLVSEAGAILSINPI